MVVGVSFDLLTGILLRVLLDICVVLLRRLQVPGSQVLPELGERLRQRAAAGGGASVSGGGLRRARKILRQCGEIGLRLRQIAGLQVLPQLLKLGLDLLKSRRAILPALPCVCGVLSRTRGKKIAGQDPDDRHIFPSPKNRAIAPDIFWLEGRSNFRSAENGAALAVQEIWNRAIRLRQTAGHSRERKHLC
jgi:hypothetical protein